MGYTTEFDGRFNLDKQLTEEQFNYLKDLSYTRRMKRDPKILENMKDDVRKKAGLPIGVEGEFFVGNKENFGQADDKSIVNYNYPPSSQPSLWLQWVPTEDRKGIEWDGSEKFYQYINWLEYLINKFIIPWGYTLNGRVYWQGEDPDDYGKITVINNVIKISNETLRHFS